MAKTLIRHPQIIDEYLDSFRRNWSH